MPSDVYVARVIARWWSCDVAIRSEKDVGEDQAEQGGDEQCDEGRKERSVGVPSTRIAL